MELKETPVCWIDDNNNKWSKDKFTKEEAQRCSAGLHQCVDCVDCEDCHFCSGCGNCVSCYYCSASNGCVNCAHCSYCFRLSGGNYAVNCSDSKNLTFCYRVVEGVSCVFSAHSSVLRRGYMVGGAAHCSDVSFCKSIEHCKKTPEHFVSANVGSRGDVLFYYPGLDLAATGCFKGSMADFEGAVKQTHKVGSKFRRQYLKLIKRLKGMFGNAK